MAGFQEAKRSYQQTRSSKSTLTLHEQFKPKTFGDNDVDIKIECCGVCGSDVHTITGGWGDSPTPIAVGHEVVGKVIKVGSKVSTLKVGDRAGVGAQVWACLKCPQCKSDNENYCPHQVGQYIPLEVKEKHTDNDQIPTVHHTPRRPAQRRPSPKVVTPPTSDATNTSSSPSQKPFHPTSQPPCSAPV